MRTQNRLTIALALAAVVSGTACRGKASTSTPADTTPPPVSSASAPATLSVTTVDVGRTLNQDKSVGDRTDSFKPADTIYVSVATNGTSSGATLTARFTYGANGKLVKEESRQVAPSGTAVTEFHIAKPDGWPVGKYQVQVSLNGVPASTKEFEVKKG